MTGTETRVVWLEGHNEDKTGVGEDGRRLATGLAGAEVGGRIFPQEQCRSPEGLGMEVTGPDLPLRKLSCWLRVSLGRGWRWQVPIWEARELLWVGFPACLLQSGAHKNGRKGQSWLMFKNKLIRTSERQWGRGACSE